MVLRGADGTEYTLPSRTSREDGSIRVTAVVDPGDAALGEPLPDGTWTVEVQTDSPGRLSRGVLPRVRLPPAVVDDRPVMAALRADVLRLQVGTVRRNYLEVDPGQVTLTESAQGMLMAAPVAHLHVADSTSISGRVQIGRLTVPANLVLVGPPRIEVLVSGLAGRYRLSAAFGHAQPVPLGVTLHVDGTGRMTVSSSEPAAKPKADGSAGNGTRASDRVRELAATSRVRARSGARRVRVWYANRSR
jgi:hypothetical protein